jgi:uncharacterized coiled-coil DUF342 family protein
VSWWRREAINVVSEIREVRSQLASTLDTLREFEERLRIAAERQEGINIETIRREDYKNGK